MSLATLETRRNYRFSAAMIPGLPKLGIGRLLGRIIGAYAEAVSTCFGTAMGLSQNSSERNASDPDRDH
jgi:hypothetical protein